MVKVMPNAPSGAILAATAFAAATPSSRNAAYAAAVKVAVLPVPTALEKIFE